MVKGRGRADKKIDGVGHDSEAKKWKEWGTTLRHIREVSGTDERLGECATARVE